MWTSVVFNACLIHVAILECIVKNLDVQIHSHTGHQACKFFVFGEPGSEPKKVQEPKKERRKRKEEKGREKKKERRRKQIGEEKSKEKSKNERKGGMRGNQTKKCWSLHYLVSKPYA